MVLAPASTVPDPVSTVPGPARTVPDVASSVSAALSLSRSAVSVVSGDLSSTLDNVWSFSSVLVSGIVSSSIPGTTLLIPSSRSPILGTVSSVPDTVVSAVLSL